MYHPHVQQQEEQDFVNWSIPPRFQQLQPISSYPVYPTYPQHPSYSAYPQHSSPFLANPFQTTLVNNINPYQYPIHHTSSSIPPIPAASTSSTSTTTYPSSSSSSTSSSTATTASSSAGHNNNKSHGHNGSRIYCSRENEFPWHTPPRLMKIRQQQRREKKQRQQQAQNKRYGSSSNRRYRASYQHSNAYNNISRPLYLCNPSIPPPPNRLPPPPPAVYYNLQYVAYPAPSVHVLEERVVINRKQEKRENVQQCNDGKIRQELRCDDEIEKEMNEVISVTIGELFGDMQIGGDVGDNHDDVDHGDDGEGNKERRDSSSESGKKKRKRRKSRKRKK